MFEIDFARPQHIHFIGIGGISMSGLAEVLLDRGFTVSGSDMQKGALTLSLEQKGAMIHYGQRSDNITDAIDAVVYTAAIHKDNPEYQAALEKNIPMLTRAQLLGQIMKNYQTNVAVAGTHGKTTTTSMISQILLCAGTDPTISVGGILPAIGGNIRIGQSGLFVTEACEYTDSFLSFYPTLGIILNIEEDHLDYFSGIEQIRQSFRRFAQLLPPDGTLIINADIPHCEEIVRELPCRVITFSITQDADYTVTDLAWDKYGHASFVVRQQGKKTGSFYLKVPGSHNVSNALAAIICARVLDIPENAIIEGLSSFTGAQRRFEYKGQIGGVTIIDDYAHHPTEITATLDAAAKYPHRKCWCIFQPHTYSRTYSLLNEFAQALSRTDHVVLAEIYPARETNTIGISSQDLQEKLLALGTPCEYFPSFDEIENYILSHCESGDLVGEHLLGES